MCQKKCHKTTKQALVVFQVGCFGARVKVDGAAYHPFQNLEPFGQFWGVFDSQTGSGVNSKCTPPKSSRLEPEKSPRTSKKNHLPSASILLGVPAVLFSGVFVNFSSKSPIFDQSKAFSYVNLQHPTPNQKPPTLKGYDVFKHLFQCESPTLKSEISPWLFVHFFVFGNVLCVILFSLKFQNHWKLISGMWK